jgi:hypothetical protein
MQTCHACGTNLADGATQCHACLVAVPEEQDGLRPIVRGDDGHPARGGTVAQSTRSSDRPMPALPGAHTQSASHAAEAYAGELHLAIAARPAASSFAHPVSPSCRLTFQRSNGRPYLVRRRLPMVLFGEAPIRTRTCAVRSPRRNPSHAPIVSARSLASSPSDDEPPRDAEVQVPTVRPTGAGDGRPHGAPGRRRRPRVPT